MTEDELNLRRKARRRLVGAIVLTLAVVVILPMILDSEPKPAGQGIELRIPAPDKVGEFVPGVAASEVAGVSPFAAPADEAAKAAPAVTKADTENRVSAPANPINVAPGKAQATASNTPEPKTPDPKTPESKTPEAKTPESRSANTPAVADGFVVQVGAYSNAGAARLELDKLKKLGFKAYTEKVGNKVRVRVGPYADRENAEKIREQLEKHVLNPLVMSVR
ncbi:MAG: SPOR domain-containing protein [Gallionella sp.]|nr:SPOR domain-containing protein [Gallionella sp.]